MFGKTLVLSSALGLASLPAAAQDKGRDAGTQVGAKQDSTPLRERETGGQSYGDRNRGGPYGFYSYPRGRHVDGAGGGGGSSGLSLRGGDDRSHGSDVSHGSAYYGRDYGAPYFGGGYYDRGVYYRERRD